MYELALGYAVIGLALTLMLFPLLLEHHALIAGGRSGSKDAQAELGWRFAFWPVRMAVVHAVAFLFPWHMDVVLAFVVNRRQAC